MKGRSRIACVSAAVLAAVQSASLLSGSRLLAANLTWDADPLTPGIQDGSGNWDTLTANWFDGTNNVTWSNATPDSAYLGDPLGVYNGATPAHNLTVTEAITVQNITLGVSASGGIFNIFDDFGAGALTLAGNVEKAADNGASQFFLGNGLALTAGQHVFTLRDTPGDLPELTMNATLSGPGGVTLDNAGYEQWGTLLFTGPNNYTGTTNINKGRLVVISNGALGTGTVNIGAAGALSLYGAQTSYTGDITISNPVVISRSVYDGAGFDNYRDAIISANAGNPGSVMTFNGPFIVDSTDARVSANTSKIVISSDIQQGPNVAAGVLTVDGDFAGTVSLTGNNTALVGGIKLIGGVELEVTNENNLGGPSSPLTFSGNATLHPIGGFMTDFGTHVINVGSFSGGIDVDEGHSFTINQDLTGGELGKRGLGTLNIGGTNNLTGSQSFYDAGVVNFTGTGTSTYHSIHLRSSVANIGSGTIVTTNNYSSLGQDSTGTNGGPDKATVNVFGTGALLLGNADFNISDNANTAGTLNISGNGYVSVAGITAIGKNAGGTGTVNLSDNGQFVVTRTGNFGFVLGDRNGSGTMLMSGGTFTSAGEVYAGQGAGGNISHGYWIQSGGVANINNWFVVGREGGSGTVTISGGTLNHNGGNISMGDSHAPDNATSMMTVSGTGVVNDIGGDFYVGNNGGALGILNVQDSAVINVNSWFVMGRANGLGTFNMSGGTVTKAGNGFLDLGALGGQGTVNLSGGTLVSNQTWIGENNVGYFNMTGGVASLGDTSVRVQGIATGTLLISGGAFSSNTLNNSGHIVISGGVASLGAVGNANNTGQGSLDIGGTAVVSATSVVQPSVSINDGRTLTILPGGTAASRIGTLAIASPGKLDLNDNDLIVTAATPAAVQAQINTARNAGAWNGPGITSGSAAAQPNHATTLGLLTGADYHGVYGSSATFDGFAVADPDVLVKYTWYGDTDFNGVVNFDDYVRTDNGFNNHLTGWLNGDFDGNSAVNFDDYVLIDLAFNTQSGTLGRALAFLDGSDSSAAGMNEPALQKVMDHAAEFGSGYASAFLSAVPEPSSAMVLAGAVMSAAMHRRRRRQ